MKHLISPLDLTVEEIDRLLLLADDIIDHPDVYAHKCAGKKLATLFFEPSTRTRLSFEAAMLELGGSVLGFSSANASSAAKGESVADTVRIVGKYADIIAMRHPKEGAAGVGALFAKCPIINAGDGGHQHPTQTLTDLLTIHRHKGRLSNLTLCLCGDLKFGRTVHSLVRAMMRYENVRFILVSPQELRMPTYILDELDAGGFAYEETDSLEKGLVHADVLYMTRVQQERFARQEEYLRLRDSYILDGGKMQLAPADMIVLHPLPRVNEISPEVDDDPRALYFEQARCGKYIRMALMLTLLEQATGFTKPCAAQICTREKTAVPARVLEVLKGTAAPDGETLPDRVVNQVRCQNPHCITTVEQGLAQVFTLTDAEKGTYRCLYCEHTYQG